MTGDDFMTNKIIIIGGVAGGATAAARLRRLDEKAEIIILERGSYVSYANCGLPYYIGGEITNKNNLTLQSPEGFKSRFNIDVRVNNEAIKIDKDNKIVEIKNLISGEIYEENYDKLILSPGAKPFIPPIKGIERKGIFSLRSIPDTYEISDFINKNSPKNALVIGGGFIGLEMAENLVHKGIKVSLAEMSDHVMAGLDFDMAAQVHSYLRYKGVDLYLSNGVNSLEDGKNNTILAKLNSGDEIHTDMIILAVGVRPESELAVDAGLVTNTRGAIVVDEFMKTSDSNIFAVGDAVEVTNVINGERTTVPLAGPANKQGRIAADNISGIPSKYSGVQGSAILKIFDMSVASTGLNEQQANAFGIDFDKVITLSPSHATYYPNASMMTVKTIFYKKDGRILGAEIVGFDGVDKRIDVLATAIRAKMTGFDLTELELAYAPPFSSAKDPVNMAGYVIENIINGIVKQFYWNEIPNILNNPEYILLDVRTKNEVSQGKIDGSIHIELDNLRENLDKLDKNKKIAVHCQSGVRSYYASRILLANGYDVANLAGGYRFYSIAEENGGFDPALCHSCGLKVKT